MNLKISNLQRTQAWPSPLFVIFQGEIALQQYYLAQLRRQMGNHHTMKQPTYALDCQVRNNTNVHNTLVDFAEVQALYVRYVRVRSCNQADARALGLALQLRIHSPSYLN